ncbi:MAG: Ig-like domain-containing protein, partial [Lachnospiraceae bacterium]|nr:Ig-like domain-containing protein [Lachnospiraceae bacterium]
DFKKKRQFASVLLSCSVVLTCVPAFGATQAQAEDAAEQSTSASGTYLTRTLVSEEDGLRHYTYTDEDGNTVSLESRESNLPKKRKAGALPAAYSSIEAGRVTSMKNQGDTGACWAFGAIKALEGSAISKALAAKNTIDLSESHLAWYTYVPETNSSSPVYGDENVAIDTSENIYGQGGDALMAIATLANWWGAADESSAPFETGTGGSALMVNSMKKADSSLRYQAVLHLKEANCYDNAGLSAIKQAVVNYGVVNVSHYYPESRQDARGMVYQNGSDFSMYQTRHSAEEANHSVSIVGWDDNYSTFRNKPSANGAWLIANSWGEDSSYSNGGYYWISYYDASLCDFYTFEPETTDKYDTNYQYDGAGFCGAMKYSTDVAAANVFTNTESTPQKIQAVSFYTLADNQDYEIHVYRNVTGNTPDSGEYAEAASTSGTALYNGFHTITLKEPVSVAANEKFSVVVIYKYGGTDVGVPLEGDKSSTVFYTDRFHKVEYKKYGSSAGQSYLYSADDGWVDTTSYPEKSIRSFFGSNSVTNFNNLCVKAYGSNITQEEYTSDQSTYIPVVKSMEAVISGKDTVRDSTLPQSTTPAASAAPDSSASPAVSTSPDSSASPAASTSPDSSASPAASTSPVENENKKITVTPLVKSLTIGKGEKVSLSYRLSGDAEVSFHSSNTNVAKVSEKGVVTGKGTGKAKITLTTSTGNKGSVTITVKKAPKKVQLSVSKKTLKKGKTMKLKVKLPSGSASYKITWQSSKKKIAAVSKKGVITAKKKGTVKITVTTFNKKKATVTIQVK